MNVFALMLLASIGALLLVTGLSVLWFWVCGVNVLSGILWAFGLAILIGVAEGSNPESPM